METERILRALRVTAPTDDLVAEIQAAAALVRRECPPKSAFDIFPLDHDAKTLVGCALPLPGEAIWRYLRGASHTAVLCVTLGANADRLIRRARLAESAVLDAVCGVLADLAADDVCAAIAAALPPHLRLVGNRFSPGYGDLPLSVQPALLRVLDASRKCGVTVSAAHILFPQKSITAFCAVTDR